MKTYFIGLGGCGLKTVAELSKRLSKEANYVNDYAFSYIDTDMHTLNDLNSKGEIIIPSSDFVDLGKTVPLAIYNGAKGKDHPSAKDKRLLEWAISQGPGHMVLPNKPLGDGAGAQRNVGRFGIYANYEAIERELTAKINRFSELQPDDNGRRDVDIWVIASSCGGTGSSMTLDILYMLNRIANPVAVGEPNVKLVLYMPQTFVKSNRDNNNHILNGYACMEEINFFRSNFEDGRKQSFEPYAVCPTRVGQEPLDFPLYQYLIPVCAENNMGSNMKIEQFYPTIAEMIYYLSVIKGKGKHTVASDLCNTLPALLQNLDRTPGVTSQMVGYGFRAIKKANQELREYLTKRALLEVVKYGLLDKNKPANFNELKVEFANNIILKKLVSVIADITDSEKKYKYNYTTDADSIEKLIENHVNSIVRYDPTTISSQIVLAMTKKLDDIFNGEEFTDITDAIYTTITNGIDRQLNEFILNYGLNNAYDLLNMVDDFYLEPLYRHIQNNLLPDANAKVVAARTSCAEFAKGGMFQSFKKAEMDQSIKKYKNAIIYAIALKLSLQIIRNLTESPSGYLEKLRKGDNVNIAGIRNLQNLLETDCTEFSDNFDNLAKAFRATADDVMTVYLPALNELATGENNSDWVKDNFFDILYRESILEQQEISLGLEKANVPVRTSANGRGLKDILSRIDINNDIFIRIIKDKQSNLPLNKDTKIIEPIKHAVDAIVKAKGTAASNWMDLSLSDAIRNPQLLPKAFKKTADLFDSFQDKTRVPVFFPLRNDVSMPTNMKLIFVGDNIELAKSLGYDEKNQEEQRFLEDEQMNDRFMVMRMPAGLEFNMYKYYPGYKTFFESPVINQCVRTLFYGCYLHQAFNKYGLTIAQSENNAASDVSVTDQLAKQRLESLVKSLFYQHVVNLLWEKDKSAYNNLFGFSTADAEFDTEGLTPEEMEMLGLSATPTEENGKPAQFIRFEFDGAKHNVIMTMCPVSVNASDYLQIEENATQEIIFDKEHTQQGKTFMEQLLSIPDEYFKVADYMDKRFEANVNPKLNAALKIIKAEAKALLSRTKNEKGAQLFGFYVLFLKGNDHSEHSRKLVTVINNVINSL